MILNGLRSKKRKILFVRKKKRFFFQVKQMVIQVVI